MVGRRMAGVAGAKSRTPHAKLAAMGGGQRERSSGAGRMGQRAFGPSVVNRRTPLDPATGYGRRLRAAAMPVQPWLNGLAAMGAVYNRTNAMGIPKHVVRNRRP